ncbi:MAG: archaellin/type IV pilin N-terminal domain-containing protein [archaeon]
MRLLNSSRKGMSPLIATVLLIAFAVALGAMIMNWSSSLGESTGPDCSGIKMTLISPMCYAQNIIKLNVQNSGSPVEAVTVRVVDDNVKNDVELKNSKMASGESITKEVPFVKSGKTYVGLIPSITKNDKVVSCEKPILDVSDLQGCSV